VVLLKENHSLTEPFINNCDVKIVFCSAIDECISICNEVCIIDDGWINHQTSDYVRHKARETNKRIIELLISDNAEDKILPSDIDIYKFKSQPVVLILAIGDAAQHYCTELMLNRIFTDFQVPFRQIFSTKTKLILNQLYATNVLRENVILNVLNEKSYISVATFCVSSELSELHEWKRIFEQVYPDFLILQCDAGFSLFDEAQLIIRNLMNVKIDLVIQARHRLISNQCIFHQNSYKGCSPQRSQGDLLFLDLEDSDIENKVSLRIQTKL
jgi:hypothetical protein